MRVQMKCINARIEFEPKYREYCSLGLQNCTGCQLAELRMIKFTAKQLMEDEKHEWRVYDYTTGGMMRIW